MTSSVGVANVVLGPPGRQRMRASQSLLALAIFALLALLQHAEMMLGLIDRGESMRLTALNLSGAVLFYALIRSGLNQRIAADPSLTLPQTVFALLVSVGSYAITGPARGAVLTLLVLILVFTMFSLQVGQSRALALGAFALLGAVMLWKSRADPVRYPPAVEGIHFIFAGVVVAAVSVLAGRMGVMRDRLRSQKLELERALERIGELATRDELTGLVNRRHMTALMQAEQARQRRDDSKLTIALIDIDLFKRVNDSYGHPAGDAVLKAFAESSRKVLRTTDVLARWGGEEFLLMLPATTPEQALRSVERLREGLAQVSFDAISPGLKVTFSAGLSACEDEGPIGPCIERADQAMYRAKTQGRNCSVVG
jgi:diguanylate cyclase (GGDEF)-like protein